MQDTTLPEFVTVFCFSISGPPHHTHTILIFPFYTQVSPLHLPCEPSYIFPTKLIKYIPANPDQDFMQTKELSAKSMPRLRLATTSETPLVKKAMQQAQKDQTFWVTLQSKHETVFIGVLTPVLLHLTALHFHLKSAGSHTRLVIHLVNFTG